MKETHKKILINCCVGAVLFAAGFLLCFLIKPGCGNADRSDMPTGGNAENGNSGVWTVSVNKIQIRVNDGYVEWFDGENWHRTETVEALQQKDPAQTGQNAAESTVPPHRNPAAVRSARDNAYSSPGGDGKTHGNSGGDGKTHGNSGGDGKTHVDPGGDSTA